MERETCFHKSNLPQQFFISPAGSVTVVRAEWDSKTEATDGKIFINVKTFNKHYLECC